MITENNTYTKRLKVFTTLKEKQRKRAALIGNLRLALSLIGLAISGYLYYLNHYFFSFGIFSITVVLYVVLVVRHNRISDRLRFTSFLIQVNRDSLQRLDNGWKQFSDAGMDFKDDDHNYSGDLDIFGQGSLFQWISTAKTFLGRRKLKDILGETPSEPAQILERQEAVMVLAKALAWRQSFAAEGRSISSKAHNPKPLFDWAEQHYTFYSKPSVKFIARLLPTITITLVLLSLTNLGLSVYWPLSLLAIQSTILFSFSKTRSEALATVTKYEDSLKIYRGMLRRFEKKRFESERLNLLQKNLMGWEKTSAFQQLEKLAKLVESISNRNNLFFVLVNILTLWDYQCMIALEAWKLKSGRHMEKWLNTIAEVEALASLAILRYDYPEWAVPTIIDNDPVIEAAEMGHPLLFGERVCNDLTVDKSSGVLLITGSNMSGKSTLLRTAGINLVLAYAGAPVCAKAFRCSIMKIMTCMRVSDNLEKSISSFYAELLRIKMLVDAAKQKQQTFFLLDEIFKGTNSQDRHLGAKILIKQLYSNGAIGMVSTHDLELGELEKESGGRIKNYHFKEYYTNNTISFDYKLLPGISNTRNALYLIKMAGIEMTDL